MDPAAHTAFGDAQGVGHLSVAEPFHLMEDPRDAPLGGQRREHLGEALERARASTRFSTEARSSAWTPMSSGSTGSAGRETRLRRTSVHRFDAIR